MSPSWPRRLDRRDQGLSQSPPLADRRGHGGLLRLDVLIGDTAPNSMLGEPAKTSSSATAAKTSSTPATVSATSTSSAAPACRRSANEALDPAEKATPGPLHRPAFTDSFNPAPVKCATSSTDPGPRPQRLAPQGVNPRSGRPLFPCGKGKTTGRARQRSWARLAELATEQHGVVSARHLRGRAPGSQSHSRCRGGLRLRAEALLSHASADRDEREGIPVTSVARTLLDQAARVSDLSLERLLEPAKSWSCSICGQSTSCLGEPGITLGSGGCVGR